MPSSSKKQHNFMAAVANNPSFAKKVGVPQSVGKDFNQADKGRKFSKGGDTMAKKDSEFDDDVKRVKSGLYMNKDEDRVYSRERGLGPGMAARRLEGRGVDIKGLAGNRANEDDRGSYKKGGNVKKMNMGGYADGGMTMVKKGDKMVPDFAADGKGKMAKGGIATSLKAHAAAPASKAHGMKKGGMAASKMGSVKTSATRDGVASKGKTKGKMIKMNMGGRAC